MRNHWERGNGTHCHICSLPGATWATFRPYHPPDPEPGSGTVMQCVGVYVGTYCDGCAKHLKDEESRDNQ